MYSTFAILRVLLLLAGWSVFVLASVHMARDEDTDALAAYLVGAGALLVALWAWWGKWLAWVLGFAIAAAGFAVEGRPLTALLLLLALVAPVVQGVADARRELLAYRESEVELSGPEEPVPSEEADTVTALEAGGYRRLGVHRWRLGDAESVTTLLVGRERDRIAGVTSEALELVSRFGERRLVTTTGASEWGGVRGELVQRIAFGEYQNVQAAHQRALGLLAARGIRPDTFPTDADAAGAVRAHVEKFIRRVTGAPLRTYVASLVPRHQIEHVLGDDERSRRRIDAWLEAPER